MKNLLSENMLRFGTKNLSESAQRELVLKSIMETINENGLHNAIKRRLAEAAIAEDPAWLKTAKDKLMEENTYPYLSIGIIGVGKSYVTPSNMMFTSLYPGVGRKIGFVAKGATWKGSTSLTVAYCPMTVYNASDLAASGQEFNFNELDNPNTIQQLINGTYKVGTKVAKGMASNAVWYPTLQNIICTAGGELMKMASSNDYSGDMRTAMLANASDTSKPPVSGQYKG